MILGHTVLLIGPNNIEEMDMDTFKSTEVLSQIVK